MNYDQFRKPNRPTRTLVRGADGRLKPAGAETDVGDVWAQQRRLQLNQAINDNRRRAIRQRLRQERGLVGLGILEARKLYRRLRTALFGTGKQQPAPPPEQTSRPTAPQPTPTPPAEPITPHAAARNVEITIDMPKISGAAIAHSLRKLRRIRRLPRTAIAALAIALVAGVGVFIYSTRDAAPNDQQVQGTATANKPGVLERGTPDYPTLLPAGKSIESLGGWTRISPPDRDPVFAYVDKLDGITISVSQQPLPTEFRIKTATKVEELAKSYTANQKLTVKGTTVHIGTSSKGPQSVIFSRDGILILIKSTGPIAPDSWMKYISSLQ